MQTPYLLEQAMAWRQKLGHDLRALVQEFTNDHEKYVNLQLTGAGTRWVPADSEPVLRALDSSRIPCWARS